MKLLSFFSLALSRAPWGVWQRLVRVQCPCPSCATIPGPNSWSRSHSSQRPGSKFPMGCRWPLNSWTSLNLQGSSGEGSGCVELIYSSVFTWFFSGEDEVVIAALKQEIPTKNKQSSQCWTCLTNPGTAAQFFWNLLSFPALLPQSLRSERSTKCSGTALPRSRQCPDPFHPQYFIPIPDCAAPALPQECPGAQEQPLGPQQDLKSFSWLQWQNRIFISVSKARSCPRCSHKNKALPWEQGASSEGFCWFFWFFSSSFSSKECKQGGAAAMTIFTAPAGSWSFRDGDFAGRGTLVLMELLNTSRNTQDVRE